MSEVPLYPVLGAVYQLVRGSVCKGTVNLIGHPNSMDESSKDRTWYRGTSLARKRPPPRTTIGP